MSSVVNIHEQCSELINCTFHIRSFGGGLNWGLGETKKPLGRPRTIQLHGIVIFENMFVA